MTQTINLPDLEIEDAPTAEQIENFKRERVNRMAYGVYVDKNAILNAPKHLAYQWGKNTSDEIARMAAEGYKIDHELAALSPHLTSTEGGVNMILDTVCYSIHKDLKQAADDAFEISKQIKQDPRKSYTDAAKEVKRHLGADFRDLPESEIAENTSRTLNYSELQLEIMKDKKSST